MVSDRTICVYALDELEIRRTSHRPRSFSFRSPGPSFGLWNSTTNGANVASLRVRSDRTRTERGERGELAIATEQEEANEEQLPPIVFGGQLAPLFQPSAEIDQVPPAVGKAFPPVAGVAPLTPHFRVVAKHTGNDSVELRFDWQQDLHPPKPPPNPT